jgi:chaperonin GroES
MARSSGGGKRLANTVATQAGEDFGQTYDEIFLDADPSQNVGGDAPVTVEMILAYGGNVAELLDDALLDRIGRDVVREFEIDEASRSDWRDAAKEYLKTATQRKPEAKNTPYKGASNIKYPLLTTACMQFAARAAPQLMRGDEVIEAKVVGDDAAGEKTKRAQRSAAFANDQLVYRCTEWEPGTDTLLHALPAVGHGFRKVYWDTTLNRVRLDFVSAIDVCVPCDAPSLELAPRITHILKKYPYEVQRLTRGEQPIWLEHDYPHDDGDSQKPCDYLEQCRYEDLDEDHLAEPYIVTVHKDTGKVVRIDPAYDIEDVEVVEAFDQASGQTYPHILSIKRVIPWIDYNFLPDPEGNYYGMGFGQLLAPISAVIDTTINELIDAGHLANTMTGFLGAQVKTRSGQLDLEPNKLKMIPGAHNVKDVVYMMEFPGPNPTLFSLLEFLIGSAKDITSVKDVLTGDAPGTQPATSTLALIEQGLQVFSAIYKRIYRSMTREFELLYRLNARYLSVEDYNRFLDAQPPLPEFGNDTGAGQAPTNLPGAEQVGAPQQGPAAPQPQMGQVLPFPTPASQGAAGQVGAGGPQPGVSPSPGAGVGMGLPVGSDPSQLPVPQGAQNAQQGAPGFDPSQMQAALAAQMPQQPQQEMFDPAKDFDLSDMDIRPVADPSAVTETQRLAKLQFALQFLGNPGVDQAELLKRAFVDSRMTEPEKLMAKPNPMMDAQAQAQLNLEQGEARKVHAEAALLEAQVGGAAQEPQLRMQEATTKQQEIQQRLQAEQAKAQAAMAETQFRAKELALREREVAAAELQAQAAMQLNEHNAMLESERVNIESRRVDIEAHKAAVDEADRGETHAREAEKTTLERLRLAHEQATSKDNLLAQLRKIVQDAEDKKAEREHSAREGDKDRLLQAEEIRVNATLEAERIKADKEKAKAQAAAAAKKDGEKKAAASSNAASSSAQASAQSATAEAIKAMAKAVERSSGPKRIVRDDEGKIIGAEPA